MTSRFLADHAIGLRGCSRAAGRWNIL